MKSQTLEVGTGSSRQIVHHWPADNPQAPVIVALHGFTGNGEDFELLVEAAGGKYHWYAPDLPGHGKAVEPEPLKNYTTEASIQNLSITIGKYGSNKIGLLGYSMGGRMALQYAVRFSFLIKALVLIGANPGIDDPIERETRQKSDDELASFLLAHGVEAFLEKWNKNPLIRTQNRIAEPYRQRMLERRRQSSAQGWANSLRGMGTGVMPSVWNRLGHVTCPTLLVTGREDAKFTKIAHTMRQSLPLADAAVLENTGHAAHLEAPEAFLQSINNFMENI